MHDKIYVWRMYRSSKRAARNLYTGVGVSLLAHCGLLVSGLFWWFQESQKPQLGIEPAAIQLVEMIRPIPNAKLSMKTYLRAQQETTTSEPEMDGQQHLIAVDAKSNGVSQLNYGQIISSLVYKNLAQYIQTQVFADVDIEVFLYVNNQGKITRVQIIHNRKLSEQQVREIEAQLMLISLPAPLDARGGSYLVPVSLNHE